ncbi:MAG: transporter substrate-binding domain-containing protein [Oscillospiraceae bacterium]
MMKSKKVLSLLLALVMSLSLMACGGGEETPGGGEEKDYASMTLDELKAEIQTVTEGKLTMATSPDFAPYEFYALDEDGTPTLAGFDIALGQYIAEYLGLELEIIPMDFDGTIAELAAGSVDIGMAGYSPDPAREDKMDFSDIYYTGGQSFVCLQSNQSLFPTLADANKSEHQIGVQVGSIQAGLAQENTPDADIVQLVKVTDIVAELLSGKLDGAFIETAVAESYAKNYPELCVLLDVPYEQAGNVVGVSKGNEPLRLAVNMAIAAALADGSMDRFVTEANELAGGATASLVDGEIVAD